MVYAGVFKTKVKADELVKRLQALGMPAFQYPIISKEQHFMRICAGLFLTRDEAVNNLRQLREKMKIEDAFLRVYRE